MKSHKYRWIGWCSLALGILAIIVMVWLAARIPFVWWFVALALTVLATIVIDLIQDYKR